MADTSRSGSGTPTSLTPTTKTTTLESDFNSTRELLTAAEKNENPNTEGPVSANSSANSSFDVVDAPSSSNNRNDKHPEEMSPGKCGQIRYGKCKWFNVAKGWGFITPNDGGQEIFVHQSVIQMSGFRSLGEQEEVEFEAKETERGMESTRVSGCNGVDCHGSTFRPRGVNSLNTTRKKRRRIRCYNCGEFSNHIAAKCEQGPQPKRCHLCKQTDHLYADCPSKKAQSS